MGDKVSRTPNLDRYKDKLLEREMARKVSVMRTPSKTTAPEINLTKKPSMKEITVGESPEKVLNRKMSDELTVSRNEAEMLPKRIAGYQSGIGSGYGALPKDMNWTQMKKEWDIREWADRAESRSKLASARDRMSKANTKKIPG